MVGLFQENGPCEVVEIAKDQFGTQARDWGWDRSSNILYIDQPVQVGFSYDTLNNASLNLLTSAVTSPLSGVPANQPSNTFLNGTFGSGNSNFTANTTQIAALSVWHMLQGFLGTFPQYNPGTRLNNSSPGVVGINLFAESYGGKYGPTFATTWEQQNLMRRNGSIARNKTLEIRLTSLGIMQGCVDDLIQGKYYPVFANNNTLGIQAIGTTNEITAANSFLSSGGCQQLIQSCRDAVNSQDPNDDGDVATVNSICTQAQQVCNNNVIGPYQSSNRDPYDIAQMLPDSFPPSTYLEYLNSISVQSAIGTPVNYTESNTAVGTAFQLTGDYDRGEQISQMGELLGLGVRVALVYGDRDYLCNWLGGEAVSFSVAAQNPVLSPFFTAGYADIVVNSSYVGGVVRQFGNLSFSRIYDSGHLIPAYQPETAFTVFTRIIMGTDISTGEPVDLTTFATEGDANATYMNELPPPNQPKCYIRNIANSCTSQQKSMIMNGQGVIINGVLYDQESDWQPPASSISMDAGMPGTVPSIMVASTMPPSSGLGVSVATTTTSLPTGVYVATATPSMSNHGKKSAAAATSRGGISIKVLSLGFMCVVSWLI